MVGDDIPGHAVVDHIIGVDKDVVDHPRDPLSQKYLSMIFSISDKGFQRHYNSRPHGFALYQLVATLGRSPFPGAKSPGLNFLRLHQRSTVKYKISSFTFICRPCTH